MKRKAQWRAKEEQPAGDALAVFELVGLPPHSRQRSPESCSMATGECGRHHGVTSQCHAQEDDMPLFPRPRESQTYVVFNDGGFDAAAIGSVV